MSDSLGGSGADQVPPHPEGYADDARRYRLDSRIATGGMGEVWLATDETLGRQVAVKLLKNEYADDAGFRTRFETEARNAARLQHPGVAGVYDYGQASPQGSGQGGVPRPYLVMEYVDGQPLSALLRPDSPMPAPVAAELLAQTADAVGAAHAAGVVHRDIKPANLMVTADRTVKITDFGIARAGDGVALTQTGQVMGTPQYLAPEQAEGKAAVPASDVYSLACVGYELLTGRRPFTGESSVAIALAHLREPVPTLPPDVPRDLAAVIERALSKNPDDRFTDGAAFARALRDPSSVGPSTSAVAAPPPADATSVLPPLAAGAAGAGLGAAAGYAAASAGDRTSQTPAQRPAPVPASYRTTHSEEGGTDRRRRKGTPGWLPAAVLIAAALLAILVVALVFAGGGDDDTDQQPERQRTPSDNTTPTEPETTDAPPEDPATSEPPAEEPTEEEPPPEEEPTPTPPAESETADPLPEPSDTLEPTEDPALPETDTGQGIDERPDGAPTPQDAEPEEDDAP